MTRGGDMQRADPRAAADIFLNLTIWTVGVDCAAVAADVVMVSSRETLV
jgi:hypothetical protein